jgi:ribulose-5-phosphate 4-epimerase/fuculose-1-phosphate aldolase
MPPALVSQPDDLIHYHVSDSEPVDPVPHKGYSERFIHGEIYRRFPSVNCVVHSHAEEVLPYVITGVKMEAVYHMAGFLGNEGVRVFDIDPLYRQSEARDMLVNNPRFGEGLAACFSDDQNSDTPERGVVLMRRHGFTCVGRDVVTAVYRAVYTRINAEAQTKAMAIAKHNPDSEGKVVFGEGFEGLTDEQIKGTSVMCERFQDKPWRLWVREVERSGLYDNILR